MDELEHARIKGNDAQALLNNSLLRAAFDAVDAKLESYILTCDPDDKDRAQRVVLGKQIFKGIRREIERIVEDGQVADFQISELEKQKKSIFKR